MARLSTYREFPSCFIPTEVAGATEYTHPVVVSKVKMFEYYYRIKKWRIDFAGTYSFDADDGVFPPFNVSGLFDSTITLDSSKTDEGDMACSPDFDEAESWFLPEL